MHTFGLHTSSVVALVEMCEMCEMWGFSYLRGGTSMNVDVLGEDVGHTNSSVEIRVFYSLPRD